MNLIFKTLREIIMSCSFKRGMWEAMPVCHPMYKEYRNDKIKFYTEIIGLCYEDIADLRIKGMIK